MSDDRIREGYVPRGSDDRIREGYVPRGFDDEDYPSVRLFPHRELQKNRHHLSLLSICHYLFAAFCGTGAAILVAALVAFPSPNPQDAISLMILGAVCFFYGTLAVCLILSGRSLAMQRRYTFCVVMAIILLLNGVLGMVLGIFTLVVLMRDSVKELFQRGDLAFEPDQYES